MVQITEDGLFEKPQPLRIRFRKVGALRYISHLDLMRTMTRVMKRAHIPVRYTAGFNPIPHLVFSAPLPVGAESPREFVDIAILRPIDTEEVKQRLNEGLPPELAVEEVYPPTTKFSDIAAAEYELRIRTAGSGEALAARCVARLSEKPIIVRKRTKSGERDVDVSPAIRTACGAYDGQSGELVLRVCLAQDSGSFLNPDYLIDYLTAREGILCGSLADEGYCVTRTHLLLASGADFR